MSSAANKITTPAHVEGVALVYTGTGDPRAAQLVDRACQIARFGITRWDRTADGGWPETEAPSIALGLLTPGERRSPSALGAAARVYPGLPTILVSAERLAREVVVLNRGQLSLVDPGISAERLASYMRKVILSFSRGASAVFTACYSRVFRPNGGWAATVTRYPSPREIYEAEIVYPWVHSVPARSEFACVLPSWGQVSKFGAQACEQIRTVLLDVEPTESGSRLRDSLGTGLMAFAMGLDEARVYAPSKGGVAWLISPRRLPRVHRFSSEGVNRIRPIPGDLYVLNTSPNWTPPEESHHLGGSELLRLLQEELMSNARPAAVALYEVW